MSAFNPLKPGAVNPQDVAANNLAADLKATQDLRRQIKNDPRAGLKAAAQQFESLFLQMVLKSMREAMPQDGPFDSDATRMYTSLADQQLAQRLSTTGQVGFARMIEQQLGRFVPGPDGTIPLPEAQAQGVVRTGPGATRPIPASLQSLPASNFTPAGTPVPGSNSVAASQVQAANAAGLGAIGSQGGGASDKQAREFVNRVWPHAVEAAQSTGIPAHFLVAHAALETGWGRSEPRLPNGQPSHNLFGIKAGKSWSGAAVETGTTEYVNGQAQAVQDKFRAYGSYAEAFRDYAALLSRPRFSGVIGQQNGTEFARGLQQAGYATDPMYADKLARIINGATLRQALTG
jgi:flagellar protein FlgJ